MSDEARRLLGRIDTARRECGDHCNYLAKIGSACEHMDDVLAAIADIPAFLAQPEPAAREAVLVKTLNELLMSLEPNPPPFTRSDFRSILRDARAAIANTSPAAAALLARGESK
jgi:hypothetical protein